MTAKQIPAPAHKDNLLGVCAALGEDFGFNPIYLRLALAGLLLWDPVVVIGSYAAAGVVVLAARWLAPNPRAAAETATVTDFPVAAVPVSVGYPADETVPMAKAA